MPDFGRLGLPETARELAVLPRGLILVIGLSGSSKTTTLASMVDYRTDLGLRLRLHSSQAPY